MKVESIRVLVRVNLGNYSHAECDVVLTPPDGTTYEESLDTIAQVESDVRARLKQENAPSTENIKRF
ncbi:hypothetical protein ACQ4M3_19240 [Leptolyngbya sp. AN03gr2]|uniref:hypothetical protein n=1 Tax=Leptolyngbya sp. AN03gr2 TaxID=3423364 RepID=UPI003D315DF3